MNVRPWWMIVPGAVCLLTMVTLLALPSAYAEQEIDPTEALRAAEIHSLDDSAPDLREAFNKNSDKTQLIVLLSPT